MRGGCRRGERQSGVGKKVVRDVGLSVRRRDAWIEEETERSEKFR